MSIVKDMTMAEYGRMKIEWVRDFMPALSARIPAIQAICRPLCANAFRRKSTFFKETSIS